MAQQPELSSGRPLARLAAIWLVTLSLLVVGRWLMQVTTGGFRATSSGSAPKASGSSEDPVVVVVESATSVAETRRPASFESPGGALPSAESLTGPFAARSVFENGRFVLRGWVRDEATRARLIRDVGELADDVVVDELVVHEDASDPIEPLPITFPNAALFLEDSFELLPEAALALEVIADIVNRRGEDRLIIRGHSDDVGDEGYNHRLSAMRVAAVFDFLIRRGVAPARLEVDPRGESDPIVANDSFANRRLNRRVELYILPP